MKLALTMGLAGALAILPSLALAQRDDDRAGVAEAIRFEKAKQAAADRQARIEARAREESSADRIASQTKAKAKMKATKSASARKTPGAGRN